MRRSNGSEKPIYLDSNASPADRAADLLERMTAEEKCDQLRSYMLTPWINLDFAWDGKAGHLRTPAHFANYLNKRAMTPEECAEIINGNQRKAIESGRFSIPALENCEALHGAQWGNATCFPQAIGLAATWDDGLVSDAAEVIAKELRAVGVRQVFAPVLNIARDVRWGRTQETYGEDPYLTARMGVAFVSALESNNVIATPKHFAANIGDGGRDSNAIHFSERLLREIYFPAFKACFTEGRARSVMLAYNSIDGTPCTCNAWLMNDILRGEWGFNGFAVSDYGGVDGVCVAHRVAAGREEAMRLSLEAGLDVELPNGGAELLSLLNAGKIGGDTVNKAVYRVLKAKFELGLFEEPFVDAKAANGVVRCPAHRALALEAARKSIVLLKNSNHALPLSKEAKAIGVFGAAKDALCLGDYSGSFGGWTGDALTPLEAIHKFLPNLTVYTERDGDIEAVAKKCDAVIIFASIVEEEGSDRSNLDLPNEKNADRTDDSSLDNAIILEQKHDGLNYGRQEDLIRAVSSTGVPTVVVLINGSAVTMQNWIDRVDAVLEAWYPGEEGGTAIAETLFGDNNPGGKLPITFPKSVGQLPLYYNYKPSGRGYQYNDNDGKPLFPFGFGLSYTQFVYSSLRINAGDYSQSGSVEISFDLQNTGDIEGDEVVQLYLRDELASVARPLKELKGFLRVTLMPGEKKPLTFLLSHEDLSMYDGKMRWIVEPGWFTVMIGSSSEDIRLEGRFEII